jgi:hypothetical protein
MIFVIHEFGFRHKESESLYSIGKQLGIPVIDDIAHAYVSDYKKVLNGDCSIVSLPKIYPVATGGMLLSKNDLLKKDVPSDKDVASAFSRFANDTRCLNERRRENFKIYSGAITAKPVFDYMDALSPFAFAFETPRYKEVLRIIEKEQLAEPLLTHVKDHVILPLNPYASQDAHKKVAGRINEIING